MWVESRGGRVALILTLLAILVTWNTVFDRAIDDAVGRYLRLQEERVASSGPFVYVQDVLRPAAAAGAVRAAAWCVAVAAAGVLVTVFAERRSRTRRAGP